MALTMPLLRRLLAARGGLAPFGTVSARSHGLATTAAQASAAAAAAAAAPSSSDACSAILQPASVWCVGRNYAEHARELGNAVPQQPMIFLKAGGTVSPPGTLRLPAWSKDVHHEVELAIEVGPDLQPRRAAVALDLTARDVQAELKKQQWPWTLAKSFKHSTPLGPGFPLEGVDLHSLELTLEVNGKQRQHGFAKDMIFDVPLLIRYVSDHFPLQAGDVVLTGTPPGVSAMRAGDVLVARVTSRQADGSALVLSQGTWSVLHEE